MATPKAVNWSATTEGDSWVYAFRFITPGGHEFTERRAETIATWRAKSRTIKRDSPEVVQAAYNAIKDAIERQVDDLDGPATEGSLTLGEKGEPTGLAAATDIETVESLRAQRDDLQTRYDALVAVVKQAADEHAPAEVADGQ